MRVAFVKSSRWLDACICLLLAALLVALQYRSGAWHADLAFDADEPAHAVSSLMVHDYLLHAAGSSPMAYAGSFYAHYPKVAIGHWPPLFFIGEALWMLMCGRSRIAMLLFVALCAAALVCSLYLQLRRRVSVAAGLAGVAVLLQPEFFRSMLITVHPEMLLALFIFWAAIFCGRWMATAKLGDALLFALFAGLALGVNGRAVLVLLLPFATLPLRPHFVRWKWLAAGALLLGVVLLQPYLLRQTDPFTPRGAAVMAFIYLQQMWRTIAPLSLALIVAGLVLAWRKSSDRLFWWSMAAPVICSFVIFLLLPVRWDDRYLVSMMAAAAALAALSVERLMLTFATRWTSPAVALLALAAVAYSFWNIAPKPDRGFHRLAASTIAQDTASMLADGDGIIEGGVVVEECLRDPELHHTVLRGSKTLGSSNWTGETFSLSLQSEQDVQKVLASDRVDLVALQTNFSRADAVLLRRTLSDNAAEWHRLSGPEVPAGVEAYSRSPQ